MRTPEQLLSFSQSALLELRERSPLVQCITNTVVTNFTANVLLALGAAPAMVDIPKEAGSFAELASGLLINLGTPHAEQREAMLEAVSGANRADSPWLLDPVAVGSLPVRTALAQQLRGLRPSVIRGNASEIIALAGSGRGGRGVDAADEVAAAQESAITLAAAGSVVAVSGPTDLILDQQQRVLSSNGTPILTRITGGGCALGAVMAAFAGLSNDRLASTVAAVSVYTVAAEIASSNSQGPGSFAPAFLDSLASIGPDDLAARAKLTVVQVGQ
ncbi:hydroxyethylthiazole kinase [Psychromicrobium lacuslunae]|uniref:Hydroxyethylthiazole kinase n=1 Tax=Psychromicrobium lacuslunae TaxID=1618207 RepID=A0A0D4C383_9MICC|nr:hydroxyethylthiazole kinase [Psychromicrobium lacuslunae]AJT43122.1 hydroxyethylthiazole kinase [Psychromicrobium lacuslunae]